MPDTAHASHVRWHLHQESRCGPDQDYKVCTLAADVVHTHQTAKSNQAQAQSVLALASAAAAVVVAIGAAEALFCAAVALVRAQ